jgi:hypothetical protein
VTIALKDIPSGSLPVVIRTAGDAAEVTSELAVFHATQKYKILTAGFVPDTVLTGANSDYRSLSFRNKGTSGSGTTAIKAAIDFTSGINATAYDYKELISASDAKTIENGEVVGFYSKHTTTGTGLACPAGLIIMYLWPISE